MESEGNIVLSSKQGSISLEGTEIKTSKDVKLLAKEKVEVRATEQKNAFSSSSSQRGAGLDMNGSLTASASGQKEEEKELPMSIPILKREETIKSLQKKFCMRELM